MSDWPDVEGALRTWLRADTDIQAIVGQRVFFGIPRDATESTFPLIAVVRVGGGEDLGGAPVDLAVVQIDCWGSLDASGNGLKAAATGLVNAVRQRLATVETDRPTIAGVTLHGVVVASVPWLPDPDNDRPRYAVTAEVTATTT